MSETIEPRKSKERSPNFPFISLDVALQRAQAMYSHERRGGAPTVAVAKHWGYSETSSGFKQTLGALKNYGLLVDEPSSSGRMVRLSDLAVRILLDGRPDSRDRSGLLRQAALTPAVASEVFQRWPEGLPSDHTLTHFLMFDRGFQDDTAVRAAKILRQNEVHVDPASKDDAYDGEDDAPLSEAAAPPVRREGLLDIAQDVVNQLPSYPRASPEPIRSEKVARSEKIIDPNGLDVTITFSGEPSQETYEFLADYIELRLKRLQRKSASGQT
ncbi:conserved hypothetical protein [Paraburkholderia tropica]|uniref:hypothetical protein n=1 Tax=Paraburkholderia tropica TaxID=92647 RepID=UPI001CB41094|nr:hypothetical protein [Paraburkholderia tropica]CAG9239331.1 conserved hypothetical protein [Paraburkholderia tropica]